MSSVKIADGDCVVELESGTIPVGELLEMAAQAMDRHATQYFWSQQMASMKPVTGVGV